MDKTTNKGSMEPPAWEPLTENLEETGMESPEATMVREWRFKVQKTFLRKSRTNLRDADMVAYDGLFTDLEEYDMSVLCLEFSKVGKVMRHVAAIPDGVIPREEEFRFRARAMAMVERWRRILDNARKVRDLENELAALHGVGCEREDVQVEVQGGGAASMSGVPEGSRLSGATALHPDSTGGSASVSAWVRSQILEAEPSGTDHDIVEPPATLAVSTDGEPSAFTVQEWRFRLQKRFLFKHPQPEENMYELHSLLATIEEFQRANKLPSSHIVSSKIGRVMNHISRLPDHRVPRNGEFKFRERALVLVDLWRKLLDCDGLDGFRDMPLATIASPEPTTETRQHHEESRTVDHGASSPDLVEPPNTLAVPIEEADLSESTAWDWRYRLQRAFLGEHPLQEEGLLDIHSLLLTIEAYQHTDKLLPSHIIPSKLGKVLNHISRLPDDLVPEDEVFKFRERALVLVNLWRQLLDRYGLDGSHNMSIEDTTSPELSVETPQHHEESRTADVKIGAMKAPLEASAMQSTTESFIISLDGQRLGPSSTGEVIVGPDFVECIGALDVNTDAVSLNMPRRENPPDDWGFIEQEPPLDIRSHRAEDNALPTCSDTEDGSDDDWEMIEPVTRVS